MGCLFEVWSYWRATPTSKVGPASPSRISADHRQPRTNTYWHPEKLLQDDEDEVP